MRRLVFLLAVLLVAGISAPAGAASEQFFEVPLGPWTTPELTNPCTQEPITMTFEGTIYIHVVDGVHVNEQWVLGGYTSDGYTASLKTAAANTFNYDGDREVTTLTANYLFRHDDGSKFRWHVAAHLTVIGGEVIVAFDMPWQIPMQDLLYCVGG